MRVMARPCALRNTWGTVLSPRTASHAWRSSAVCLHRGRARSRRPLPWTWTIAVGWNVKAVSGKVRSSETRRPAAKHRCIMARSRRPARVWTSGASSIACISAIVKIMDQRLISFLLGDRKHPAALFEARRDAIFDEAHKGFDGSQARVAGTGTIAPLGLQMREKIHHQLRIEML